MKISMVDLHSQYLGINSQINEAIGNVIRHTQFINGPETRQFSEALSTYLSINHVIPCANGTDALQLALMALELQPGDEVITPTFTFGATVEVVALLGLKPVFVDVEMGTFNMDVEQIEKVITPKTKVIVPVHLFGQAANMERIVEIAQRHHLFIVEDAAQCIGSCYTLDDRSKKMLGGIGHIGCTSFFPTKNLGCFGDGGACFTNDDVLAQRIHRLANHGSDKKYHHQQIGINSRLDTLQAAVLLAKLPFLDEFNHRRKEAAQWYDAQLANVEGIIVPQRDPQSDHVFHQYTIRVLNGKRGVLMEHLKEQGVPSMVYYPVPMHHQEAFKRFVPRDSRFPVSDMLCDQVLSLPMHTEMHIDQINYISNHIINFLNN